MLILRIIRGLLLGVCILVGIVLVSNIDKGFETFEQDRIDVYVRFNVKLADVVQRVKGAAVAEPNDTMSPVVSIPYGETEKYLQEFRKDRDNVLGAERIPVQGHFSLKKYAHAVQAQVKQYAEGNLGNLIYPAMRPTDPPREYSINSSIKKMIARSLSYLLPALLVGIIGGYALAWLAVWKPRLGKVLDGLHAFLLGLPDFFVVALLQILGVYMAKAAGHKVISIMQVSDDVPFLIPFVAISLLPGALLYGALRIAVAREWEEGYIQTAYAKGVSRTTVIFRHILRNTAADLLAILPRAVSVAVTSLVVAEIMAGIFGLGGYSVNERLQGVTSLATTCAILAGFVMIAHALTALLRSRLYVATKEDA